MRIITPLGFSFFLVLAGCSQGDSGNNRSVDINAAADAARSDIANYAAANAESDQTGALPEAAVSPAPLNPPAPGTPGGLPDDRTPISEAPFTPDSAQGAANVVQTYYALIGEGKYRQAWALWDDGGKASGMSADAFAASFGKYSEYHANVGAPGAIDAGAGQRYVTVPVQVYGRLKQGATPVYMLGSVTLHRAGDIDGATAEQKSWHLHSADIKPRAGQDRGSATNAPERVTAARYRCMDGSSIQVSFETDPDTATIRSSGVLMATLHAQRAASGMWYKAPGYELRGKGDQVTFTKPHTPPLACRAIANG